jgi:ribonucleotide monophosphatase NagD (HAD superfamily)
MRLMAKREKKKAAIVAVSRERFLKAAERNGFKSVRQIVDKAKGEGLALSLSTVYAILGNENYNRRSLEKLALVVGVSLTDFVTFEAEPVAGENGATA